MTQLDKRARLEAIKTAILDNNICPDLATTATQLVMGEGSPDAEIVFIGEAPGKNEDESGLPFVGAAGRILNEMLASINLERSDVYITNIVKYRPPNNRDPLPAEKAAFLPYLIRQLQIIEPRIIVTLGRHSTEYFLPGTKISEIHGEMHKVEVVYDPKLAPVPLVVVPLFHPAAALYNGSLRQTLLDDFGKLRPIIDQLP